MTSADIVLVLVLSGFFLFGFFWGVVRSALAIAAWAVAFLLGANLISLVGGYLAGQWTSLDSGYVHMLAFGIVSLVVFVGLLIAIWASVKGPANLTSRPLLDDLIGGSLGLVLGLLVISSILVILRTFYDPSMASGPAPDVELSATLYRALSGSAIGTLLSDTVIDWMAFVFGSLVPEGVREAMAA